MLLAAMGKMGGGIWESDGLCSLLWVADIPFSRVALRLCCSCYITCIRYLTCKQLKSALLLAKLDPRLSWEIPETMEEVLRCSLSVDTSSFGMYLLLPGFPLLPLAAAQLRGTNGLLSASGSPLDMLTVSSGPGVAVWGIEDG